MNPSHRAVSKLDQIERAEYIRRSLGVRSAAGYLKRNRWTLEAALLILVGEKSLERHLDRMLTC
jgi:hypothetical protein